MTNPLDPQGEPASPPVRELLDALWHAKQFTMRDSGNEPGRVYCDFCEQTFDGPEHPPESDCGVADVERVYQKHASTPTFVLPSPERPAPPPASEKTCGTCRHQVKADRMCRLLALYAHVETGLTQQAHDIDPFSRRPSVPRPGDERFSCFFHEAQS